jgi:hypothetical protein
VTAIKRPQWTVVTALAAGLLVLMPAPATAANNAADRIRVTNNRFTTAVFPKGGAYGPVAAWDPGGTGNIWTGNVWADGPSAGRPVTP